MNLGCQSKYFDSRSEVDAEWHAVKNIRFCHGKKLVEGWETERKNKQLVFSLARAWFEFLLRKNEGKKKKAEGEQSEAS